jgi:hypothetical protein
VLGGYLNQPVSPSLLQGVVRIRARCPEFGSLPSTVHPPQLASNRGGANRPIDDPSLKADLCEQFQRPSTLGFSNKPGTLV